MELAGRLLDKIGFYCVESGLCKFIRNIVAGNNSDVIAGNNMGGVRHADRETFPFQNVFCGFVVRRNTDSDLIGVMNPAPRGIHGIRRAVLVVGGDDEYRHGIKDGLCSEVLSHKLIPPKMMVFQIQ